MRRKDDTLRDTLLAYARELADTDGPEAVNIRSIAGKAGVATGTVYNYFAGKDEILLALTEEYWKNTLLEMKEKIKADNFCKQMEEIYSFLRKRIDSSAGMLMHSLGNVEDAGLMRMESMKAVLEKGIVRRLEADDKVRADIWNETFTKEQYARFIMMNMILLLKADMQDFLFFLEIVKKTIYE